MRARITADLLGLAADEAGGFARAKPRRSTTKTAYRVEGTTTSSAQKTKSRRDRVFFRRVAEPRGGNFYAFPRALSVEHARLTRVARVRTAFRRGGSALLTRFFLSQNVPCVTIPSRHPSIAAETGFVETENERVAEIRFAFARGDFVARDEVLARRETLFDAFVVR